MLIDQPVLFQSSVGHCTGIIFVGGFDMHLSIEIGRRKTFEFSLKVSLFCFIRKSL
jgi:hypothetical protein